MEYARRNSNIGKWLCVAAGVLGAVGLIGWTVDWPFLTTLVPNQPSMKPNTALALVLLGVAALLRYPESAGRLPRLLSAVLALLVLAVGTATLIEYALRIDLGIDRMLLPLFPNVALEPSPGRPSPPTAFALAMLASAVLLLDFRRHARARPSEWLVLGGLFTAFAAVVGFLYGAGPLYRLSGAPVTGVAVPTAAALVSLGIGLLLARPDAGIMRLFTSTGPGGIMFRRLSIAALLAPAAIGPAAIALLERLGVQDLPLLSAGLTIAMILVALALLALTAPALNRVHDDLEASRKSFSDLIEHAPDAIFVADAEDRYTHINEAGCRLLGVERGEIIGKRLFDVLPPEDVERFKHVKQKLLAGESPVTEWLVRRKDGSRVPVEVSARMLADGRSQAFMRDIGERKRVEEELRQSRERLDLALRGADLAAWDWNVKTSEVIFNARWAEMRGYRSDEIEPHVRSWISGVHPDDRPRVQEALDDHFAGRVPEYATEHRVRAKSGEWLWILDRGKVFARDERGQPVRMVGTELDITTRKRKEREERLLGELAAALASTLDIEQMRNDVGRLVVGDIADICMVETVDQDAGRHVTVAYRDQESAAAAEALQRAPRDGAAVEGIESLVVLPLLAGHETLGTMVLASTTSERPLRPDDIVLAKEVARRTVAALEKARLYKRALEATRARDELLAVVAHDLRNPLSALLLEASLLRRQGAQPERQSFVSSVEAIEGSARRMTRLIDDLLDVTRIESGRLPVKRARVSTRDLVADCARAQMPLAARRSLELRLDVEADVPDIHADRDRLLQVLDNLVANAMKFTAPGGRISLGAARAGQEVRFSVSDTGSGISAEHLPHVFDRFWQAPNDQRRGAGLGLAIVKGIVEAHGGRVWAESAPGLGSTFHFSVPIAAAEAGRDRPPVGLTMDIETRSDAAT